MFYHQIAQACGQHGGLGQDLVAMCVNDVLAQGAEPLFFLDYFSCGSLDVDVAASVVGGIAKACEMAGCALLGERGSLRMIHIHIPPSLSPKRGLASSAVSVLFHDFFVSRW